MRRRVILAFIGAVIHAAPARAQEQDTVAQPPSCVRTIDLSSAATSETRRALWRALSITRLTPESGLFRSSSAAFSTCADSLHFLSRWQQPAEQRTIEPLSVEVSARANSAYPRSINDGAAWLGKGWTLGATGGARGRWRFLTAQIAPQIYHQQNGDFAFPVSGQPGFAEFANAYHGDIDLPSRFGDEAFSTFDLGQTFVQAQAGPISVTAGTENIWMGAAERYPLLLSYTAPGFPHVRIGTQTPLDLRVVDVEFHAVFASLSESDYFDGLPDNDDHYFTITMAVLKPHFLPGLSLSVARAYHDSASASGQSLSFYFDRLIETPFGGFSGGNRVGNAIGVVMGRWVLPESGFEAYAEWSREDTPGDWKDVLREPDWTQAYVLGFQKAFLRPRSLVRFYGELIHLGESAPARAGRGFFSYYTHGTVTQGHTHKGQLLGAAIGPGSDAALLGVDVFSATGRSSFRIERARYDEDTYYRTFARRYGETRHDAEISLSAGRTHFVGPVELQLGVEFSRRYGRSFIPLPTGDADLVENNWGLMVGSSWRPNW